MTQRLSFPTTSFNNKYRRSSRIAAAILIGLLASASMFAQLPRLGLGLTASASANGFGTLYTPALYSSFKKTGVSFGPAIQKEGGKAVGVRFLFDRFLCVTNNKKNWVTAYYNGGVYQEARLGQKCMTLEKMANPELAKELSQVYMKGSDHHAGICIYTNLYKGICLNGSLGVGYYDMHLTTSRVDYLYHSQRDVSAEVKFGLFFALLTAK